MPLTPLKASLRSRSLEGNRHLVDRIRSEFGEMQGFSPTLQQAVRLFHLSESECYAVLVTLVEEGFLRESADGRYRLGRG
jgi:DNA-binding IclR family transcriptional regulator